MQCTNVFFSLIYCISYIYNYEFFISPEYNCIISISINKAKQTTHIRSMSTTKLRHTHIYMYICIHVYKYTYVCMNKLHGEYRVVHRFLAFVTSLRHKASASWLGPLPPWASHGLLRRTYLMYTPHFIRNGTSWELGLLAALAVTYGSRSYLWRSQSRLALAVRLSCTA